MTISRQFYLYVAIAFLLVIGSAIGLTYQFATLSAEGARLIANLDRTATLNQELVRGNSEQSDSLRRQLTHLDSSFPDQYRKRNYTLGDRYAEYLKLDIGEQERLTVEQIRALQSELSILSMHLYEQLRMGNRAEADVRLNRLSQMESLTRSRFEELNRLQLDKLRAVVDRIWRPSGSTPSWIRSSSCVNTSWRPGMSDWCATSTRRTPSCARTGARFSRWC
jgi:hypothetical protein